MLGILFTFRSSGFCPHLEDLCPAQISPCLWTPAWGRARSSGLASWPAAPSKLPWPAWLLQSSELGVRSQPSSRQVSATFSAASLMLFPDKLMHRNASSLLKEICLLIAPTPIPSPQNFPFLLPWPNHHLTAQAADQLGPLCREAHSDPLLPSHRSGTLFLPHLDPEILLLSH